MRDMTFLCRSELFRFRIKAHSNFTTEKPAQNYGGEFDGLGTLLLPGTRNTDGFYVALLRRR